ncbi:MAG: TerS protein [Spartobacteria bacterium]|nr:TerS protein [Spartobacteria bacterium]
MKRRRSDSFATEGEMARAAPPHPPSHITVPEHAMPHWWAIVSCREYAAWTAPDLEHAASMACALADIERLRNEIREEGDVITPLNSRPIVNPKHQLVEMLSKRSIAIARLIHVHAEATIGKSQDEVSRNKKQREVATAVTAYDDDLIARPARLNG